ncbi:hypothetical protein D3C84_688410 [compost metagenome]
MRALITTRARLMRDSSPPEATLPSGWIGCPGLVVTMNSTRSMPRGERLLWASGRTSMAKRPSGIASSCMLAVTWVASSWA